MVGRTFSGTATARRVGSVALVAAAIGMGASIPSYAAEQTLAVSLSGDSFTVSVPANSYDDTSKLYLVWGTCDCGEKISAWPRANRLLYDGSISATAATYQFSAAGIPAGSVVRAIVASDVRLIDGWVKLETNQYIDTGIKGNEPYGIEIKMRPTGGKSGDYASLVSSSTDNFTIGRRNNTLNYYLRYRSGGSSNDIVLPDNTDPHAIKVTHTLKDKSNKLSGVYVDGEFAAITFNNTEYKKVTVGTLGTDAANIFVGTANNGSGSPVAARYCHAEWHHVRILDNNGYDMRHLVPAIRGNTSSPEGVFYDIVTETVFANAGSGSPGYDTAANVTETIPFTTAYSAAFPTAITAYWTGLGDRTNVNDSANWACTNAVGVEVSAYPDTSSIVYVRGATNFNVPAGQRLAYNELHIENCSLATNCDWRGLAVSDTVDPIYTLQYADIPNGAYFDTGFAPNNNTRVVMDVTVRGTTESLFGITDDASKNWWKIKCFGVSNDGGGIYSGFGNDGGTISPVAANGRHIVDFDKGVLKVDGTTHTTRSEQTFQLTRTLYLFADHRPNDVNIKSNNPAPRFHSCKIYDNGTLIRDYVPVQNNGYVCLYDRVNGTYANNIGNYTGNIVAGPSLGDKVGFYNVTRSTRIDMTVNLAGHSLTLAHTDGTGTITDTVGGGELHFDVASGETIQNSTLTFTGQMKLVKDGAGTFVGAKADQTYTGGTVANAGWLKQGAYSGAWGPHKSLITICKDENADTGAGFDWNGKANDQSTTAYSFKIAGTGPDGDAAMKTSVLFGYNYWNANHIADMELDGDATVKACLTHGNVYGFEYLNAFGHNLVMNGHTLTVAAGDAFAFRGVTVTGGGTIVSVPDTSSDKGMRRLSFFGEASDLSTTTLDVHDMCGLNLEKDVTVKDFIDRRTLQWNDGTSANNKVTSDADSTAGMLFVIGRFQPHSTNLWSRVTLGDATHLSPTFDLSALEDTFEEPAVGAIALNFAEGANVNIDVGSRAIAVGDKLISWRGMPECSFTLVYSGEVRPIEAVARTDGLYVKSSVVPAYAMMDMTAQTPDWVFYDVNGNIVPDWEDGVTAEMQVRFASYEEYVAVRAKNVSPFEFLLTGGFTLPEGSGTCDMSGGFAFTAAMGITIDANGRRLVLPDSMVAGTSPFTVTSSIAGGELEVTVASGTTITNTAMSLTGSLKLTKKGAGTLVGAKANQTYTGGTFIDAGIAQSAAASGAWGPHKATITVADGASFDYAGKVENSTSTAYSFVTAGTGVGGAGAIYTSVPCPDYAFHNQNHIADMELAGDTLITIPTGAKSSILGFRYKDNLDMHYLTMNNHTLTLVIGDRFAMSPVTTIGSGTIVCLPDEDGTTYNYNQISFYGASSDLSTVTLDLHDGTALNVERAFTVGSFIDRRTVRGIGSDNTLLTVLDRFQPTGTNTLFKTIQLGDATHLSPTLDLGDVTGTYTRNGYTLSYASGATVTVNLAGTRTDLPAIARTKDGSGNRAGYVLTWASKPANVEFVLNEASKHGGYKLEATDSGLLLMRRIGLKIIVR